MRDLWLRYIFCIFQYFSKGSVHIPNRENILCYSEMVEEKFIIVVIINWLNVQNTEKNTAFVFYIFVTT